MRAPAHTTLSVQQFLLILMPHPPYSSAPALSDLFLFPQIKKSLQRETFCQCGRGETKKTAEALKAIKNEEFKTCFEQWKNHLDRCIKWRVL